MVTKKQNIYTKLPTVFRLTRDNKPNIYEPNVPAQFDANHGHNFIGEFVQKLLLFLSFKLYN